MKKPAKKQQQNLINTLQGPAEQAKQCVKLLEKLAAADVQIPMLPGCVYRLGPYSGSGQRELYISDYVNKVLTEQSWEFYADAEPQALGSTVSRIHGKKERKEMVFEMADLDHEYLTTVEYELAKAIKAFIRREAKQQNIPVPAITVSWSGDPAILQEAETQEIQDQYGTPIRWFGVSLSL